MADKNLVQHYIDGTDPDTVDMDEQLASKYSREELIDLIKQAKPFILQYVVWAVGKKEGNLPETIRTDLVYFVTCQLVNKHSKDTVIARKMAAKLTLLGGPESLSRAAEYDNFALESFIKKLHCLSFIFNYFKIPIPDEKGLAQFQNEYKDDLEVMDANPVEPLAEGVYLTRKQESIFARMKQEEEGVVNGVEEEKD